jgi:radical SAM superfamily enzyme YgiQ (UPF0313 family)
MKMLLIKPCWPYPYGKGEHTYNRIWPPLSLANCAAILERHGHTVKILDAHAQRIKPHQIKAHVPGFDKVFITSSSLDRWQCPNIDSTPFIETVLKIREMTDEMYVMGYHGTVDPVGMLNKTRAKAVIRGGPEYVVSDIAQNRDFSRIDGITYQDNGNVISNPDRKDFDLTNFPVPAFHLLDMKRYFYEILGDHFCLFELGRGCNFGCKFCNRIMYEPKLRTKSKQQVRNEIKVAVEDHGVRTGYFMDLEFLAYKPLVRDLCEFLIERNYDFKWCCQTRADSVDRDILDIMKKAGCELIHIGVESGIQKYLDMSGKNTTEKKLIAGMSLCKQAGIKTLAFFMFGFRGETPEDRERIFAFAKKLKPNFASFHKVYPYLKSDMYSENRDINKDIDNYVRKAFLRYYLRFEYIRQENILTLMRSLKLFLGRLVTLS